MILQHWGMLQMVHIEECKVLQAQQIVSYNLLIKGFGNAGIAQRSGGDGVGFFMVEVVQKGVARARRGSSKVWLEKVWG